MRGEGLVVTHRAVREQDQRDIEPQYSFSRLSYRQKLILAHPLATQFSVRVALVTSCHSIPTHLKTR